MTNALTVRAGCGNRRHPKTDQPQDQRERFMPKEEWGTKRLCPTTGKRFYDLNKDPIVSPYTGEVVNLDTGNKSRVAIADKAEETEATDELELVEDADAELEDADDADVDIDDDLLEDDDDDNMSLDEIADVAKEDDDS